MTDKTVLLEKKLSQAISARKALEEAKKTQVTMLCDFASKLSFGCRGQDVALDNQLAKFRSALSKGTELEQLTPVIENAIAQLKQQETIYESNERALKGHIQGAGKQLQKLKGLPDDTRRKLRYLLDHELGNIKANVDYVPLLDKLLQFYMQTLQAKAGPEFSSSTNNPELAVELLALTNELVFEEDVSEQIKQIKHNLSSDDSVDSLLANAVSIIRIFAKSIARERQSAQGFLVSLNQTLEELHKSIVETTNQSKSVNQEVSALNKRIEEKITKLNVQTQQATSISELKLLVDNELKELSKDLIERENIERKDKETLLNSFDKINDRINVLESKVTNYKKRLNEQKFKSLLDGLTKLPNRAAFDDRYNQEFHLFEVHNGDVTLVVIDVDHFKSINDKYGHSAGDKTLQVIARALKKSIRKADFIARYGGEEFVLLMPGMPLSEAKAPLEKIRATVKAIPFRFKEKEVQITISLGATQLKSGDTTLTAFDRADNALYDAKNSGRDRLCLRE
ncbi:diguanylate cyclase [Pseudoalteromonas luteoviolacea]|uniref:diguanylate cyclase n=1 Tax=Pseudoalteromonas luteoviolacea TaxID=43657 RepID=A0A1C0TRX5_9GAMM|nr:GGDEF domain-containing protein [Pseudoalteromonas luteoviolacea]MBQ4810644.1 diguanylate cyclase [Pseudoalteromonas luteoviolacea]OCQ22003.1 diguanylate cyclase [Pseudoalteromonas luteoviolacea]